jgi:hypothetical protein
MFYNPLWNQKKDGCKTLMPHQWFSNIISMGREHTQGGYLFILNIDLLQMEITWIIYSSNKPPSWVGIHVMSNMWKVTFVKDLSSLVFNPAQLHNSLYTFH